MRYIDSGKRDASESLGAWIKGLIAEEVAELRLQTGFFGKSGLLLLRPVFALLRARVGLTYCLIGSNDVGTGGEDVRELVRQLGLPRPNAKLAVCAFGNAFFHPKVIHLLRTDGTQAAYVGSANLTESGVHGRHIESGVLLDTRDGDNANELTRIALAVDAWFDENRKGLFSIADCSAVAPLVTAGILAPETAPDDSRPPTRKTSKGERPALPMLAPLLALPPTESPTREQSPPLRPETPRSPAARAFAVHQEDYFLTELSKNRASGSSFQADIGKAAFVDFFGGRIGGRIDIVVNTLLSDGRRLPRTRPLIDVKSKNYRLEIDFPEEYPTQGRPVAAFRRLNSREFDCLLLMPENPAHSKAIATIHAFCKDMRPNKMKRATITHAQLLTTWSKCPLLKISRRSKA